MNEQLLFDFLKKHNITYRLYEHQPVFTVGEEPLITAIDGKKVTSSEEIPGAHFKTLFLKDKKGKLFLVSVTEEKRVDLKALSDTLSCSRFSFGKPELLLEKINLTPGSVSPYGLMFDKGNEITYALDEDALSHSHVTFHPLRNDMTIAVSVQDFLTCMDLLGHKPQIVRIPTRAD